MKDLHDHPEQQLVVGAALPPVVNKKPPLFTARFWTPFSYILYLWYSPVLSLVSDTNPYAACKFAWLKTPRG